MRFLLIIFLLLSSCSSKKDILLIQDTKASVDYNYNFKEIRIKPDDILRIKISSKSVDLTNLYSSQEIRRVTGNILSYQIDGYLVDADGFVNIPILKPIYLKDLTLKQASKKIKDLLDDEEVLKNASVDIKFLNSYFTVLGEVKNPGRYSFLENNMNVLQALGIAGDLTINGKRDDIRIISTFEDKMIVKPVNLTSSKLLTSENFQIFPGDVIIVNANNARVKNAGVIGNFGNLLSVMSFILSSIILISN